MNREAYTVRAKLLSLFFAPKARGVWFNLANHINVTCWPNRMGPNCRADRPHPTQSHQPLQTPPDARGIAPLQGNGHLLPGPSDEH